MFYISLHLLEFHDTFLESQTGRRPQNEDRKLVQKLSVEGESRYVLAGKF